MNERRMRRSAALWIAAVAWAAGPESTFAQSPLAPPVGTAPNAKRIAGDVKNDAQEETLRM